MSPRYQFALATLNGAPADSGVYILWDKEVALYIGHVIANSHTINSLLMEHYVRQRQPSDATHYSWEICREAAARAAELIRQHQAAHNAPPLFNEAAA
jgi:hypothetical protein